MFPKPGSKNSFNMRPLVSVVILNWNGKEHLIRCLTSLSIVSYKPLEIIVVDNNSRDDSVSVVKKKFSKVKIVANSTNRGFSGGNNDGIIVSRGKYVFILNNDTEVEKNFLEPLVTLMEKDSSIGCVQPRLIYGDDHSMLNAVGSYLTSTGFLYHYGYRKRVDDPKYNSRLTIYSAKGAAMMLRKSALDRVGTFDEVFIIYFEETDLCHRLWLSGYKVIYEPSSLVYHYEAVDTHKQMENAYIMYLSYRNRIASYIKNLSIPSILRLFPILCLFYIVSCALYPVAVLRALMWNIRMFPKTIDKRRLVQRERKVSDSLLFQTIWRDPPVVYYYYLFKSLKHYHYEPSLVEANRY